LRTHIIDPSRGCQKVPEAVRERVRKESGDIRNSDALASESPSRDRPLPDGFKARNGSPTMSGNGNEPTYLQGGPGPSGESRRATMTNPGPKNASTVVGAASSHRKSKEEGESTIHIGIEFSRESGMQLRALWIATELLGGQFSKYIGHLSLVPVAAEHTFSMRIDDKAVWTRVPGQAALDYDAIRPILMAYLSPR
jgi:predicted Rdx family selenoprotein